MDASPITPDLDEALRYAGVRADESGDMHRKMAEIAAQCMKNVTPRCTYRVSEIAWENGMPSLFGGQLVLPGRTAAVMLRSCSHAALLVCTLGTAFDALARQVQARNFADALLLDGFGGATRRSAKSPRSCPVSTSPTASAPATAICRWTCKVRCWR